MGGGGGLKILCHYFMWLAIYFNYTVCPKYILSPQNDMFLVPEPMEYWPAVFSQPLYRLLRIGAAIFISIGNFEDGFGSKKVPTLYYILSFPHTYCLLHYMYYVWLKGSVQLKYNLSSKLSDECVQCTCGGIDLFCCLSSKFESSHCAVCSLKFVFCLHSFFCFHWPYHLFLAYPRITKILW